MGTAASHIAERTIRLQDIPPGSLEQLRHTMRGAQHSMDLEVWEQIMADLTAEIDEKYRQIEREVPGWER